MFRHRRTIARDRGLEIWLMLPESQRTAVRVLADLKSEGFCVSRATVFRWVKEWRTPLRMATDLMHLPAAQAERDGAPDLSDIPAVLREVLPERVLAVARGQGLDKVDQAIASVAGLIREKIPDFIKNGKSALLVAGALQQLASAAQTVMTSRAVLASAHHEFAEGDKLMAEAEVLQGQGRVHNAKDVTPRRGEETAADLEAEAFAILRGDARRAAAEAGSSSVSETQRSAIVHYLPKGG